MAGLLAFDLFTSYRSMSDSSCLAWVFLIFANVARGLWAPYPF